MLCHAPAIVRSLRIRTRLCRLSPTLLFLALLAVSPARSEVLTAETRIPPARIDSLRAYVDGLAAFGFTGQIVISQDDSILVERAAGVADRSGRPVDPHTRFALGSVTKSLAGALVVRAAARGRLDLDAPIARHLDGVPADKKGIALRHLLTHTSGLPMDAEEVHADDDRDRVVQRILAVPLLFEPGTQFQYSNAGFQLLAAVLERVYGRPFATLVEEEIFVPCGMEDTGTGAAAAHATDDVADGRNEWKLFGSIRGWRQRWAGNGAGDLVSTGRDLWRWARALQGGGPFGGAELDTLLRRRTRLDSGSYYGFGIYTIPRPGRPDLISLGGDVPGYHATVVFEREFPRRVVSVVMSGERFGRRMELNAIQSRLWRLLGGGPVPLPPAAGTWPRDRLELLAGAWALPGDDALDLTVDATGTRLGFSGSGAMDVVFGTDSLGGRDLLDARARTVLEGAAISDSALAAALVPVERELWSTRLREGVTKRAKGLGPFLDVIVDGTVPLPWLVHGARTYARVRHARGDVDVSLAWLDGALLDVAFDEGRPHPVVLPVAPLLEGGLAAWDVLDGTTIRIEPFQDDRGPGLLVTGPAERTVARRPRR